ELFPKSVQILDLQARDKEGAIRELLRHLVTLGRLDEAQADSAAATILEKERQASTGIGRGLAVPHAKNCGFLQGIFGVFGRSRSGVSFNSVDGDPVSLLFLVISSTEYSDQHVSAIRKVAKLGRDEKSLRYIATVADQDGILEIFREIDAEAP